jgi:type I restriction enzyme R subunit
LELITEENLNEEAAKRYITASLKREYASENGTELECTIAENESFKSSVFDKEAKCFSKVSFVCREV